MSAIWDQGYWHIARTQMMQYGYHRTVPVHANATMYCNGTLLQATVAPVWTEPLADRPRLGKRDRAAISNVPDADDPDHEKHIDKPMDPRARDAGPMSVMISAARIVSIIRAIMSIWPKTITTHEREQAEEFKREMAPNITVILAEVSCVFFFCTRPTN